MSVRFICMLVFVVLSSTAVFAGEALKGEVSVAPSKKHVGPPVVYVKGRKSLDLMGPSLLVDGRLCVALGVKRVKRALRLKRGKGWTTVVLAPDRLRAAGVAGLQRNDVVRFDYAGRGRLLIRCARFGNRPRSVKLRGARLNQKKRDRLIEAP